VKYESPVKNSLKDNNLKPFGLTTEEQTDRPTNISKTICPLFFEGALLQHSLCINKKKRAYRSLSCSPEEKVKCQSAAIYRRPQGHNLNNFGREPLDNVIYQI